MDAFSQVQKCFKRAEQQMDRSQLRNELQQVSKMNLAIIKQRWHEKNKMLSGTIKLLLHENACYDKDEPVINLFLHWWEANQYLKVLLQRLSQEATQVQERHKQQMISSTTMYQREIKLLQDQKQRLFIEITKLKAENERGKAVQELRKTYETQIAALKTQLQQHYSDKRTFQSAQVELDEAKRGITQLQERLQQQAQLLFSVETTLKEIRRQKDNAEQELKQARMSLRDIESRLHSQTEQSETLKRNQDDFARINSKLSKDLEDATQALSQQHQQLRSGEIELAKAKEAARQAQQQLYEKQQAQERLTAEVRRLQFSLESSIKQVEQVKSSFNDVEAQKALTTREQLEHIRIQHQKALIELADVNTHLKQVTASRQREEQTTTRLRAQLKDTTDLVALLRSQNSELQRRMEAVTEKVSDLEKAKADLEKRAQESERVFGQLRDEITKLTQELSLRSKAPVSSNESQETAQLREDLEQAKECLMLENRRFTNELTDVKEELETCRYILKRRGEQLEETVLKKTQMEEEYEKDIAYLKRKNQEFLEKLSQYE